MSNKDKNEAGKIKSSGSNGNSGKGGVFEASPKRKPLDIPTTGAMLDSPVDGDSESPFDVDISSFEEEKKLDTGRREIITSTKTSSTWSDSLSSDESIKIESSQTAGAGRRKETSILFSLGNLHSLANEPESTAEIPFDAQPDGEKKEMSGLIDIRSLTEAFAEEKENNIDEFLSMGSTAFGAIPTLQARGLGLNAKIAIGSGAAVLLIAVIVGAIFALSGDKKEDGVNEQIAALKRQIEEMRAKGSENPGEMAVLEAKLAQAQEQEANTLENKESADNEKMVDNKTEERKKSGKSQTSKAKSKDETEDEDESEPRTAEPATPKAGSAELDSLLGGSGSSKAKSSGKSDSSGGSGDQPLERADVQRGMATVADKVKACGTGQGGMITMKVVIGSNGSVLSAKPTGAYSGTQTGSCAAQALKAAKFPKSKNSTTVSYPFRL